MNTNDYAISPYVCFFFRQTQEMQRLSKDLNPWGFETSSHATEEREGKRDKEEGEEGEKKGVGECEWVLHLSEDTAVTFFIQNLYAGQGYTVVLRKLKECLG